MAHVVVLGGGHVGQLIQLSLPTARLLDNRRTAPKHHQASRIGPQYLWEPIPGVPSHSFSVTTLVDNEPPTPESILAYKKKIGKEHDGGDWGLQFQHKSVGWFSELPVPRVEYNRNVVQVRVDDHLLMMSDGSHIPYDVLMNTIPLPTFLQLCDGAPKVYAPWRHDPIYMVCDRQSTTVEGMIMNYSSDPGQWFYRETLMEDRMFYETLNRESAEGSGTVIDIVPGKIHPHSESEIVVKKLQMFDIFSFGRFATWRPDELAHQTWQLIDAWKGTHDQRPAI